MAGSPGVSLKGDPCAGRRETTEKNRRRGKRPFGFLVGVWGMGYGVWSDPSGFW
jgi:hypothetical protein